MPEKFGTARYMPEGDWVRATATLSVVGLQFRRGAVEGFCRAVTKAEAKGRWYGVDVRPNPRNQHDPNAIEVFGVVDVKPWFGRVKRQAWHVGFIDRDTAAGLARDLTGRNLPIAGELYSIYRGHDDFVDIKVLILAPPGNSQSKRARRARDD